MSGDLLQMWSIVKPLETIVDKYTLWRCTGHTHRALCVNVLAIPVSHVIHQYGSCDTKDMATVQCYDKLKRWCLTSVQRVSIVHASVPTHDDPQL